MVDKNVRDKFLTEAMEKCWHGVDKEDKHTSIRCFKCNKFLDGYWVVTPKNTAEFQISNKEFIDFSTWQRFGELWEFVIRQKWLNDFLDVVGHFYTGYECNIETEFINPDRFANAVYEFLKQGEDNLNVK
jgi:hypothetical protein